MPDQQLTLDDNKLDEVKNCGKPIQVFDRKTGTIKIVHRRCKRWRLCPICAAYKREMTERELFPFLNEARFLIVSKEEEAKITRRYGGDNIRRVSVDGTHSAFVIQTDDQTVGQKFTENDLKLFSKHCIPEEGRRMSGKLGKVAPVIKEEKEVTWEEIEQDTVDPVVECHYREFRIEFESPDLEAPKNEKELEKMVHDEVEIDQSPKNEWQLQDGIYALEQKAKEICERYEMSFNFLDKKIDNIRISEVDWKWIKNRHT